MPVCVLWCGEQTVDPVDAPAEPEKIRIEFEAGVPVKVVNHHDKTVKTNPLELFLYLNEVSHTSTLVAVRQSSLGQLAVWVVGSC